MAKADKPGNWAMPEGEYAGDVSAAEAWQALANDRQAILVDVRTEVEWTLIGKPDLSSLRKDPIFLQWVKTDGMNERFMPELKAALEAIDCPSDAPIYFMCQSGGRSKMAAMQCTTLGYTRCFNIADGFEGDLDEQRHRNSVNGWKAGGLPWFQS